VLSAQSPSAFDAGFDPVNGTRFPTVAPQSACEARPLGSALQSKLEF
jgi:hypothetical protein